MVVASSDYLVFDAKIPKVNAEKDFESYVQSSAQDSFTSEDSTLENVQISQISHVAPFRYLRVSPKVYICSALPRRKMHTGVKVTRGLQDPWAHWCRKRLIAFVFQAVCFAARVLLQQGMGCCLNMLGGHFLLVPNLRPLVILFIMLICWLQLELMQCFLISALGLWLLHLNWGGLGLCIKMYVW